MSVYNGLYMALHIADREVDIMATRLAELDGLSKTEALRRLLKRELDARKLREQRQAFVGVASRIVKEARSESIRPVTKEEMDALWGYGH